MTTTLVTGIAELLTNDPEREIVEDAAVVLAGDTIGWVGPAAQAPAADEAIDLGGRAVIPGFVDSHSHLVFAGDRSAEFAARMTGEPYDGGGIATTVAATRAASDDELRALVAHRVEEMHHQGTTTVEIKSGYGLTIDDEVRALKIAREFTTETTYLGAHVVPSDATREAYVDLVAGPMLRACAPHARWIDVFCEPHSPHAFDADETRHIVAAGRAAGLRIRLHGNQIGHGPGVQVAVEVGAASVDHCTYLSDDDIAALAGSDTVATLLPGVEFSTRSPYPSGRRLLDAGVSIALASDCNPGTCYSSSMPLMIALAVREMGLTPLEAVRAATLGSARALRREDIGVIAVGKRADLTVLDAPSYRHLAYRPGVPIARSLDEVSPS
ncbi:imidazolonepropionase [Calidifontibacter sp. DB0510]|uniref:Imidazolonepropionase n=1 Tax=Metallococcus carri TaxID=1656884 RepID=A0A967B1F0_9MICO|nr:imidazolonepropionase [Metallococcus carri]NHN57036.1 imidazolonepropionase [Metallococcus carri]NOP39095.1 imidazolonepropionase [Calidifontibacter sp. DB2511S]